jgi:polyisoprenoid-binding protein YceI
MRNLTMAALIAALFLLPAFAHSEVWMIDTPHSAAQFSVRHMMISNVKGEFTKVTGTVDFDDKDITLSKVDAAIDATTISTREPKRDAHLKSPDFFDVAKFPTITFKSASVSKAADGRLKVTGDLTMHGVTRQVVLEVEPLSAPIRDRSGAMHAGTSATTRINRKDFGIAYNSVLETGGVMVGDEVTITIDVELVKRPAPAQGGSN